VEELRVSGLAIATELGMAPLLKRYS